MVKKWFITIAAIIVLVIAWYLISPAFRTVELQETSPIVNDALDTMTTEQKAEFDQAVEASQSETKEMEEVMPQTATILSQGTFEPRAHEVEGSAVLIQSDGEKILRFEDFDTINGPRLHVYLSTDLGTDDFIDLGPLKATKGNFNYELDPSIDTSKYNKVLVWCVPFSVLFSYAEI